MEQNSGIREDIESIKLIVEKFKSFFTEEELKMMEEKYNQLLEKNKQKEKSKEVQTAYSRSIENQNYFDY